MKKRKNKDDVSLWNTNSTKVKVGFDHDTKTVVMANLEELLDLGCRVQGMASVLLNMLEPHKGDFVQGDIIRRRKFKYLAK